MSPAEREGGGEAKGGKNRLKGCSGGVEGWLEMECS